MLAQSHELGPFSHEERRQTLPGNSVLFLTVVHTGFCSTANQNLKLACALIARRPEPIHALRTVRARTRSNHILNHSFPYPRSQPDTGLETRQPSAGFMSHLLFRSGFEQCAPYGLRQCHGQARQCEPASKDLLQQARASVSHGRAPANAFFVVPPISFEG